MKLKGILPGLVIASGPCSVKWTTIDGDDRPSCILAFNGYYYPSTGTNERQCDAMQCCYDPTSTFKCYKSVSKHNLWNSKFGYFILFNDETG